MKQIFNIVVISLITILDIVLYAFVGGFGGPFPIWVIFYIIGSLLGIFSQFIKNKIISNLMLIIAILSMIVVNVLFYIVIYPSFYLFLRFDPTHIAESLVQDGLFIISIGLIIYLIYQCITIYRKNESAIKIK